MSVAASGGRTIGGRVLLVTYHFPPDAAVGGMRPAKFAKYLRRLGWDVSVLTIGGEEVSHRDDARLAEVAGCRVWRTKGWPTLPELGARGRRRLAEWMGGNGRSSRPALAGSTARRAGGGPRGWRAELRRYAISLGELPDAQIGWLGPATWRAWRIVTRERIDAVVTSSPPRTTALIGAFLGRLSRVPVVTDLRDPWYWPELRDEANRSVLAERIERRLEAGIVRRSSRLVTTTERYAEALRRSYPWAADRIVTISNGYDLDDYGSFDAGSVQGRVRFAYFGSFYLQRTPREFLVGLAELRAEGTVRPEELEVCFVGSVEQAKGQSVTAMLDAYGLRGCVEIHPTVPYREALRQMQATDVLLLFAPAQPYCVPAKAFDYLGARRPILCVADEGATADLIRRTGAGVVVAPGDVGAMKEAIRHLLRTCREAAAGCPRIDASPFDRKVLAERLSDLLHAIREGGGPRERHRPPRRD